MEHKGFECPICSGMDLVLRHEASYIYSYKIDSDAPGLKNSDEFLSYLYDNREQKDSREYIECNSCKAQYPYSFIGNILGGNKVN